MKGLKLGLSVICLSMLLSLFVTGEAIATTYYVSQNGNDSNSGTQSYPFRNIQKAANKVNPGDTVIVKDGTYTDTDGDGRIIYINRSGNSSNWITFKSESKWGAKLSGQNNTATNCIFLQTNAAYLRFEDFEIYGCANNGYNINSDLKYGSGNASHDVHILRNKIHDIGRRTKNTGSGLSGITIDPYTYNINLDSNIFYDIGRLNPSTTPSASAASCTTSDGRDVCYTHDHGIYARGSELTIINNIFHGQFNSGWPVQGGGKTYYPTEGQRYYIINNTFYSGANPKRNGQIVVEGYADEWHVENNIFYGPKNEAIWHCCGTKPLAQKNNMFYRNNFTDISAIASIDLAYTSRFTTTGNILQTDPKVDNNFRLQSGSEAIDAGLYYSGRTQDHDGNPIVGAPDIGAYEYNSQTPGTDNVSPAKPIGLKLVGLN